MSVRESDGRDSGVEMTEKSGDLEVNTELIQRSIELEKEKPGISDLIKAAEEINEKLEKAEKRNKELGQVIEGLNGVIRSKNEIILKIVENLKAMKKLGKYYLVDNIIENLTIATNV